MALGGGRKDIDLKLRNATKTRILNLSEAGLKTNSSVWEKVSAVGPELRTLDISKNILTDGLPMVVFSVLNVRSLSLSGCSLSSIADVSMLNCMTTLKLDHNKINSDSIAALPTSLTNLNISSNALTELPTALIAHPSLKELIVKDNKITDLSGIETIMHLTSVNCDNNLIMSLPEQMGGLLYIQNISLVNNKLVT